MNTRLIPTTDPRTFHLPTTTRPALLLVAGSLALAFSQLADAASATVRWDADLNDSRISGYEVHYGLASGTYRWSLAANANGAATNSRAVADLQPGNTYFFAVRACSTNCEQTSAFSDEVSVTMPTSDSTPPSAPGGLSATALSATENALYWTASTDNTGVAAYQVERCQGSGCSDFSQVAVTNAPRMSDAGLIAQTTYRYRVRAADAAGNLSGYSAIATATTESVPDTAPPSAPGSLSATALGAAEIALSWSGSNDDVGVAGYWVQRCQGAGCSNFSTIESVNGTELKDSGLAASTTYRYRVAAQDGAGNVSGYSAIASASTRQAPAVPTSCSGETLWQDSEAPETTSYTDTKAVELGMKFRSDRSGYICGLRFYKGPSNTGAHVGSLWRADGTLLAQAVFSEETATGWQQVDFATPVAITADTVYVASYYAPNGGWSVNWDYFAAEGLTNGALTVLQSQGNGKNGDGNGVYKYGASGFPTSSWGAPNYWVDVVFTTDTATSNSAELEYGEVTINHEWRRVSFKKEHLDPVVIAQPLSANGADPSVVRVKDVTQDGFSIRLQEWDYLDGRHTNATAGYLVMERGQHQLSDGTWVEAGYLETDQTNSFDQVSFDEPFDQPPVVVTAVTSDWDAATVATRVRAIDETGFKVGLEEQEASDQVHGVERIDYIAWPVSSGELENGLQYAVGRTRDEVTHNWYSLYPDIAFQSSPILLAAMQTTDGGDTATLRWRNKNEWGVEVRVEEEASRDSETNHTTESVGYFLIELPQY